MVDAIQKIGYLLHDGEYLRVAGQMILNETATIVLVNAATAARNINNDATLQSLGIEAGARNKSVGADFKRAIQDDANHGVGECIVSVSRDASKVSSAFTDFVKGFNAVISEVNKLTVKDAPFQGDYTVTGISY